MSLSINCSCKIRYFIVLICFTFLSGCSKPVTPAALLVLPVKEMKMKVAVLPIENLSGRSAPFKEIRRSMIERIKILGIDVLEDEATERFMTRQRMRYMGGINTYISQAFKSEEKVDAVLISSLELYSEEYPPKIGLICRLVSTGEMPEILWMDTVNLSGNDSFGFLGLGLIYDPVKLRNKAVGLLARSLEDFVEGKGDRLATESSKSRYRPKLFYQSQFINTDKTYTLAVMPFINISEKRTAGEIVLLHIVNALVHEGNFVVLEPGVLRQNLLNVRVIMHEGLSLNDAYFVSNILDVDLILSGKVVDYQDVLLEGGIPTVSFSSIGIERMSKKIVWISDSYNHGNDQVFFFELGKLNTAGKLASEMARAVAENMSRRVSRRYEQQNEPESVEFEQWK